MDIKEREQLTKDFKAFATEEDMDLIGIVGLEGLDEMNAHAKIGRRPKEVCPTAQSIVVFAVGHLESWAKILTSSQDDLLSLTNFAMNIQQIRELKLKKYLRQKGFKSFGWGETGGIFHLGIREAQAFRLAGLGYVGKNQLANSKKYGPRMYLGHFFTEAPLVPDQPYTENHCGVCDICERFCTSKAIMGDNFFNARRCESVINCRPNDVFFSLTGWHDCDMCYRKCPQGEYKFSSEERKGTWWDVIQRNREASISQHSIYLSSVKGEPAQ
jgi:epoxyqueuosine reductase QueG